jgi:hypothetical protein
MAFKRGGIEAAQQLKERDFATLKGAKRNSLLFARRFSAINLLVKCVYHGMPRKSAAGRFKNA